MHCRRCRSTGPALARHLCRHTSCAWLPASGPIAGGTTVTITGTNFSGATAVHFGGIAAAGFTVNGPTSITAITPAGSGIVDVTVTAATGTSAIHAADQFTYQVPLTQTITFPQPASPAYAGTSVTMDATATSGLAVTYTVISGPATVNSSTLTYTGAGTIVVEADQAGNGAYLAAAPVRDTDHCITC